MLDEYKPTAGQGKKEDRIMASLSPLYQLQQIYHFRGGLCQELERQIVTAKPDHDDIADVMASVQEIAYPPGRSKRERPVELVYNSRFGGVSDLNYN
jgi:hypothetical protein